MGGGEAGGGDTEGDRIVAIPKATGRATSIGRTKSIASQTVNDKTPPRRTVVRQTSIMVMLLQAGSSSCLRILCLMPVLTAFTYSLTFILSF